MNTQSSTATKGEMMQFPGNDERNHPNYGPCDGFGPGGNCSYCTGKFGHDDGSITDVETGAVLRKARLRVRLQRAWWALCGVARELEGRTF